MRDPRDAGRPAGPRGGAPPPAAPAAAATVPGSATSDPLEVRRPGRAAAGPTGGAHRAAPTRPDPAGARLAAGMVGAAATTAILAAIVAGSSAAAGVATSPAGAQTASATDVPVRHVTQYVTIPSDATPPPRKVVYATPVPAPRQQVVVVTTSQSGGTAP